jgi:periplasmic protein TonB
MKLKESKKTDMGNKRGLSLQIGMFGSLAIVLSAFTNTEKYTNADSRGHVTAFEINEKMIPVTCLEEVKLPIQQAALEMLNIVNAEKEITDNTIIKDCDATKDNKNKQAQVLPDNKQKVDESIFVVVENMPEFPGGDLALRKFIAASIKYPVSASENGIQGKVFVNFVVDKDGRISNVKVARGVDPSIDREALRVVMTLPKWRPGLQRGKAVRVSYTIPISFQLQ